MGPCDEGSRPRARTSSGRACANAIFSRQNLLEKTKHRGVELFRILQRSEMAHTVEKNEFGVGNASSEIFGVFAFDKFIMLALHDHDRYADLREIARGVV